MSFQMTTVTGRATPGSQVAAILSEQIQNGSQVHKAGAVFTVTTSASGDYALVVPALTQDDTTPIGAYYTFVEAGSGLNVQVVVPVSPGGGSVMLTELPYTPGLPGSVVSAAGLPPETGYVLKSTSTDSNEGEWEAESGGGGNPVTVNDALAPAALAVTQQPVVPPSGIVQPLPPLIGFVFPGVFKSFALEGARSITYCCVGRDGNIWFTDQYSNGVVWRVTPAGVPTSFVLAGSGDPYAICSGADGNIWVIGSFTDDLWQVTPTGTVTHFTIPGGELVSICAGADGNLWAADYNSQIWRIALDGTGTAFPLAGANPGWNCAGPDGNIWVTDQTLLGVWKVTPQGAGTFFAVEGADTAVYSICAGADGNLWALNQDGAIFLITPAGESTLVTTIESAVSQISLQGMAAGAGGDIWLCESDPSTLWKITPEGVATSFAGPDGSALVGICSGPDGSLWIADNSGNAVLAPFYVQLGGLAATALPTADPHVEDVVWSNAGVLTLSAG